VLADSTLPARFLLERCDSRKNTRESMLLRGFSVYRGACATDLAVCTSLVAAAYAVHRHYTEGIVVDDVQTLLAFI